MMQTMDWSYPLRAACERHPRRVALRHRGREVTFGALEDRVAALARGLGDRGVAGRTVAWMLPNAPVAIELSMALARIGAVAVPLNDRLNAEELAFIAQDSGAGLLVTTPGREGLPLGIEVVEVETLAAGAG